MTATAEGLHKPYLAILDLSTSEHLKLYNKANFSLLESDRYYLTRSKWNEFYQELEDAVSIFGFKSAVIIVTDRYGVHITTEVNKIIMSYPSITQAMVDSRCEILWENNPGAVLGRHPTGDYGVAPDDSEKQEIITPQLLSPKTIGLWIKNLLTTNSKHKLRAFRD